MVQITIDKLVPVKEHIILTDFELKSIRDAIMDTHLLQKSDEQTLLAKINQLIDNKNENMSI
ncbi:MAG TPA: hypothetical protein PKJ54_02480 [Candidatus Pacearchaeota archaeon]|jgi:hypothetical protein|nr:hypothetical protein [Candidatus Pacearchaeota archaeon]